MHLPWRLVAVPLGLLLMASISGCNAVFQVVGWGINNFEFGSEPILARVTNLSDSSCRDSFSEQLDASLVKQGEPPAEASVIASETTAGLSYDSESLDPRPFHVSSAAGHRYGFFVQSTKSGCVLRLYERYKGPWSSGNANYDRRHLSNCSCSENINWPEG